MNCRHCDYPLEHTFLDLGFAPPSNAYLTDADLKLPESQFPLKLFVCNKCWLVQIEDFTRPTDLFSSDYAYFSSISSSWVEHASRYVERVCDRFKLNSKSYVVEIGDIINWNSGYWEISSINESQFVGGQSDHNHSVICNAFLVRMSNLNIERVRSI